MSDRLVHLVRHSAPIVDVRIPSNQWVLSSFGLAAANEFAEQLAWRMEAVRVVASSDEPKARSTALPIARVLDVPLRVDERFAEQRRAAEPGLDEESFRRAVEGVLLDPAGAPFGTERGDAARDRFLTALDELVESSDGDVIVVSHGTVMALALAERAGLDPVATWRSMSMPWMVTTAWPSLTPVDER